MRRPDTIIEGHRVLSRTLAGLEELEKQYGCYVPSTPKGRYYRVRRHGVQYYMLVRRNPGAKVRP
jgi:hypothetical protein